MLVIIIIIICCVVSSAPVVTAKWTNQSASIITSFNITVRSPIITIIINKKNLPMHVQEQFDISDGIDGSATNYTILYFDSISGKACSLATISASACIGGQCNHKFHISSDSMCSNITSIVITVFATSILGTGPSSEPVHLEFSKCYSVVDTNQTAYDVTSLYSIVGGTSTAVVLSLMIIIIIILLVKKLYTSYQK